MHEIKRRLTYANVMATIAVFVALGGGAYAAVKLPRNSVGTPQIKANAVNSAKVKNGSLRKGDFRAGQLPAGARGAQGQQGPQGTPGVDGAAGPPGPTASTFASRNNAATVYGTTGAFTSLLDLASLNDQGNVQITTTFPARIMATANVNVGHNDTDAAGTRCDLEISNGTGPTAGFSAMGNPAGTSIISLGPPPAFSSRTKDVMALTGSAVKQPGTYNVQVKCAANNITSGKSFEFSGGNLNVWAIGT